MRSVMLQINEYDDDDDDDDETSRQQRRDTGDRAEGLRDAPSYSIVPGLLQLICTPNLKRLTSSVSETGQALRGHDV